MPLSVITHLSNSLYSKKISRILTMPEVNYLDKFLIPFIQPHRLIHDGRDKATYWLLRSNNYEKNADFGKQHLPVT
jgi:hypothetical protein